jgi:hypothetical protein
MRVKSMTREDARREIFFAITECRDDRGSSLVKDVDTAHDLANGVVGALMAKELLKLDDED